ncbi:MAG: hypothetical protein QOH26_258 [Actinomycetota bacterium]|nr:hypothetical protein [Actinomycetota bacterium]
MTRKMFAFVAALVTFGVVVAGVSVRLGGSSARAERQDLALNFSTPQEFLLQHYLDEAMDENKAPEDAYLFQKLSTGTAPTPQMFARAVRDARAIGARTAATSPRVARAGWRYVGPSNIGARVVDITVDPKLANTLYVASASGGVWKSTDAGKTYKPIWKKSRTQSLGAMAQAKNGTLWVGTGEANPGGGSLTYGGKGVFRSDDRGKTWTNVGLKRTSRIGRIVVDPNDANHVLVAAAGNLFKGGGPRGLYETRDGGKSWKLILEGENETTGAVDVAIDPKNPKNIFVAMWDHIRFPDFRQYSGEGSGIWRSQDGGKTFEELTGGLPPGNEATGGRIGIAIDPKNPDRVWAIYSNNVEGPFSGFFISEDGGDTWTGPPTAQATLAASQSVYGWWFGRIYVDPKDSEHVFVSGLGLSESTDGGLSFPTIQIEQHADHHAMAWDPHKPGRVYNGNDGGVYRSEENGADGSWIHGKSQPWSQFFVIDVSAQDPSRINGGLQDQGSVRSWGGDGSGWNQYNGGDGVENAINPTDKQNVYACSQYGACGASLNGGDTFSSWECQEMQAPRCGWKTPIRFAPSDGNVVYWAGSHMSRSTDKGQSWEQISPDLGDGDAGRETNPLYAAHFGTVQAIALSKKKPDLIWAGTDNGLLWKTKDGGGTWTKIVTEDEVLPTRWITQIALNKKRPRVVYVTYSGFRDADNAAYVFRSTNGGKNWVNISRNLPRAPVNDIEKVGKRLYVATDVGVFVTKTGTKIKWLRLGRGLPLSPINDIEWVKKNGRLYAGTFGRGIYKVRVPARL